MKFRFGSTALDGRTMTLTARQSDLVGGPITVSDWGKPLTDTPNASVTISVTRTPSRTAPEHVYFEVTGWSGFENGPGDVEGYDARMHDFVYLWDFGDTDAAYTTPVNVLAAWKDANKGYGPRVAHVYSRPSQPDRPYVASVLVIEPDTGKIARAQVNILVADPNVAFVGSRTYYYSKAGDYSRAPAGAITGNDLVTLMTAQRNSDSTVPKRIMLARGEDTTLNGLWFFNNTPDFHMVAEPLDRENQRPKPILRQSRTYDNRFINFRADSRVKEAVFQNIQFIGNWDSTTETSASTVGNTPDGIAIDAPGQYLVDGCYISGWYSGVGNNTTIAQHNASWITLHNSHITNWLNFGFWASGAHRFAVLGTIIAQDPNALSGGVKDNQHNAHGPIRHQPGVPSTMIVDGSDFFSRNGWFENVGSPVNYHTQQPCIRYNQAAHLGSMLLVQRSSFEGGFPCIVSSRFNNSVNDVISNMIVERSAFLGSHMTSAFVASSSGGVTVRGNLMIHPDVQRLDGMFNPGSFVLVDYEQRSEAVKAGDGGTTTFNAPIKIISNTCINLLAPARRASSSNAVENIPVVSTRNAESRAFQPIVNASNNLLHQPNLAVPHIPHGPLDKTPLWTRRETGYRDESYPLIEATATPTDSMWAGNPLAGSKALGASNSDDTAYDDLYGKPRPPYPSLGALEKKE